MPSISPGSHASTPSPSTFDQILPGAPSESLQAFSTFVFRFKRYVTYVSGCQLSILSSPTTLIQAIRFQHELTSVVAENETGKLVVSDTRKVWVLEPLTEGWTRVWWTKTLSLRREDAGDEAQCLSWGDGGELLVGGSRALSLFSTLPSSRAGSPAIASLDGHGVEERRPLWSKSVASSIRQAEFSPTASMIASCSRYDRLLKIWRRLSFEEGLFDHTYLPHPSAVTHLEWRPLHANDEDRRGSIISGRHDEDSEVLYTIASDGVLRVWRTGGILEADILVLHTSVDLIAAIPQSPSLTIKGQSQPSKAPRYAVFLPSDQFCAAVNAAVGSAASEKVSHSKELLKEMISKEPDVVVTLDGQGRMSAWGVESIGHKRRVEDTTPVQPYHIAHAEGLSLRIPGCGPAVCKAWFHDDEIHLLTHTLHAGGEITWWQGNVEAFFSSSASDGQSIMSSATWCGHDVPISEIAAFDKDLTTRSADEITQWLYSGSSKLLKQRRSFGLDSNVLAVALVNNGELLLTVTESRIALWDDSGRRIAKGTVDVTGPGSVYLASPNSVSPAGLFVQEDGARVFQWSASLARSGSRVESQLKIEATSLVEHPAYNGIAFATPVRIPFGETATCVVAVDQEGVVKCCSIPASISSEMNLDPFATFTTNTCKPGLFVANEEFAALTSEDRTELVLADLTDGYIEHRQRGSEPIKKLAPFRPEARHNFLAVAYDSKVEILAQGRYEHHSSTLPVWMCVKTVSIAGTGLSLAAIGWTYYGGLTLAAANSLIVTTQNLRSQDIDNHVKEALGFQLEESAVIALPHFTHWLKNPLPAWHPSFLSHLLRHGQPGLAAFFLKKLAQKLKFWSAGEDLDLSLSEFSVQIPQTLAQHDMWIDDDTASDLRDQLEGKDLPQMSLAEQRRLRHVIEALLYIRDHAQGLDKNALRYLFDWKMQLIFAEDDEAHSDSSVQPNGVHPKEQFVPEMHWREICFAYHSTTQQALLDILVLHHDNKLTWAAARRLGVMAWLSEREALEQVFEQLGQTAYRSEQPPDPVNASLYYLALHRKSTLLGLWRIATWHKEQKATINFLKRNFNEPEARTAAKKNAYALMGKRRFHYAAAFFLLADDPASATSVLAGQCEDPEFAIAVARLYCNDSSPVVRELLERRMIPKAREEGNRWLMSWCHSVLLEISQAAEALIRPLDGVRTWHQDDPTTLLLYEQLRKTPSEHEYNAVLRAARISRRMGLWFLALEMVSKWEFKPIRMMARPSVDETATDGLTNGTHLEPTSLLDDFVAPTPKHPESNGAPSLLDNFPPPTDDKTAREAKAAELLAKMKAKKEATTAAASAPAEAPGKKPEPTQFKEPDPNSLLDSFGF